MLVDKGPSMLNPVSTEKMARKVLGGLSNERLVPVEGQGRGQVQVEGRLGGGPTHRPLIRISGLEELRTRVEEAASAEKSA